jgi:hypothetical protein
MSSNKTNFNMNGGATAAPGTALSDALAVNTVLTELGLSNNYLKPEFARELAVGIRLSVLSLRSNSAGLKGNQVITHLNISFGPGNRTKEVGRALVQSIGAQTGSHTRTLACLAHTHTRSCLTLILMCTHMHSGVPRTHTHPLHQLSSLNISGQRCGPKAHEALMEVMMNTQNMKAMTSLDVSNNNVGQMVVADGVEYVGNADGIMCYWNSATKAFISFGTEPPLGCGPLGIIALSDAIHDMGALSRLNASNNNMFGKRDKSGITAWADSLKASTSITELNLAGNKINAADTKILAPAIADMGAMTSLDLASNGLGAEGAKIVAEAIKVTMCTPAIIMAPFSCPSDFSNNCCCLLLSAGYGGYDEPESCVE